MMRNGVTRSIALALCLSLPVPVMAGSLGKLVNEGNSAFEKSEEANKQWLKKEQEADRKQAEEAERQAEEARRNPTYYAPSPSESGSGQTANNNRGVTRDGDGWVKVDGRTIGRAWVSYGYNVSCTKGYNSGYGSNSAFGGSFKPNVHSMDEAVGVLLAACRR